MSLSLLLHAVSRRHQVGGPHVYLALITVKGAPDCVYFASEVDPNVLFCEDNNIMTS